MQTIDNQASQPVSQQPINEPSVGIGKSLYFTRHQIILIGFLGGLVLLFTFGLGVRAGEKRALRKQLVPQTQPTPTNVQSSPTTVPIPTPSPTIKPSQLPPQEFKLPEEVDQPEQGIACKDRFDCIRCLGITPCKTGECINGVCVWPSSPPAELDTPKIIESD